MSEDSKRLILNIEADASSAAEGLKALSTALSDLKGSSDAASPMRKIADAVRQIREAAGLIEADTGAKLTALGRGLSEVAKVGTISLKATTSDRIGNIALASRLLQVDSGTKLTGLAEGLKSLSNVSKLGITQTTGKQIGTAAEAAHRIPEDVVQKLSALAEGMNALSKVEKSSMGTTVSHLRRLPEILKNIGDVDISKLKPQIDALTEAMKPLAVEMDKIARGFSAMPKKLQSYITSMERAAKSTSKLTSSVGGKGKAGDDSIFRFFYGIRGRLITYTYLVRRVMSLLGGAVNEANQFVEDLNLFTVAMGQYTKQAMAYAEQVQEVMGIDMGEWMRNQGVFKTMAQGFGIAEDAAYKMSKGLTELAYDTASFYNISFESAMEKFRSGLAGQPRPLRELGFAIDDATLSQIALSQGITESTRSMNQADKAMLRYIAMMSQQRNIMGDLARTMHTPANAMRLLGARTTTLARTFGSILIPILSSVIPYLQVFLELLIKAAQAMASLFGFELPTIDYSGIQTGVGYADELADGFDNVGDSAGKAGQAIKEFKNYLLGFDEMHIIPSTSTEDSGGGGLGGIGGTGIGGLGPQFDWELPDHSGFMAAINEEITDIRLAMQDMVDDIIYYVEPLSGLFLSIGGYLVGAFAADKLAGLAQNVLGFSDETRGHIDDVVQAIGGIAVAWYGTKILVSQYVDENIDGVQLFIGILGTLLTSIGMVAIAFKNLGLPAWLGAIIAAGTVAISFIVNIDSEQKLKNLEDRFGNISLSMDEIKELALEITKNPWRVMLEGIENKEAEVKRLRGDLEKIERELRLSSIKVGIGIEVKEDVLLATAEDYVSTALEILKTEFDQKLLIAELTFPEGSSLMEIYLDAISSEFNTRTEEIETIGSDFRELIDSGAWGAMSDTDKSNAIQQLVRDTREIMDASVAEVSASRRLSNLGYRLGLLFGDGLNEIDWESYKKTATESQEIMFDELGEIRFRYDQQIADIEGRTEIDPANKRAMVDELEQEYSNIFSRYVADNAGVHLDTGWESFYPELKNINMDDPYKEIMAASMEGLDIGYFSEHIDTMQRASERELATALFGERPDGYTRHAANQFIDANEEVFKALDGLADQYISRGEIIPQWLVEGLRKKSGLEALAGELDGLHYIMGEGFANDPQTLRALASVEGVGAEMLPAVVRGLYSQLDFIKDETTGAIVAVRDVATGEVAFMSEVLYENLIDAGIGLNEATRELVYGISEELHGDVAGGGGGRAIAWLESFLTELGVGLGLAEETAGSGARTVVDRVKEFFNPTSWFGIGTESGSALGEGGAGGILGWLFGLGEASSAATETVENNLGDWFGLGGSKGEGLITAATEFLSDPAGYLGGAANTAFANLRSAISGQEYSMESAMTGVTNRMKGPFNVFFADLVTNMSKSLATVGELGIGFQFEKNTTTGGYYSVPGTLIPQMYASGGYPTAGELFLMNEREPEFLTTVGGRTAVVNQDQMSQQLAQALYSAVVNGMGQSRSDGGDLIIQIDGKEHNLGSISELKRKNQRAGRAVIQVG